MAPFRLRGLVSLMAIFLGTHCCGKVQQTKIAFLGFFWPGSEKSIGLDSARALGKDVRHALPAAAQQLGIPFAIPAAAAHLNLPFVALVTAIASVLGYFLFWYAMVAVAVIVSFCVVCVCGTVLYIHSSHSERQMLIKEAIPVIVKKYEELSTNLSGQAHGLWTGLSATAATAVKLLPEMPPLRPPPPALNEWSQSPVQRVACSPEADKDQKHPSMHWGTTDWGHSGEFPWHSHNYVEVLYVKSGQLRLEIEGQGVWDASPGEKIVVPARTKHRIPPGSPYCRLDIAHD